MRPLFGIVVKPRAALSGITYAEAKELTASQINKKLDALDKRGSKLNQQFIDAGRGDETADETYTKNDPLALQWREVHDEKYVLRAEIKRRYGPGAPSRLPLRGR